MVEELVFTGEFILFTGSIPAREMISAIGTDGMVYDFDATPRIAEWSGETWKAIDPLIDLRNDPGFLVVYE